MKLSSTIEPIPFMDNILVLVYQHFKEISTRITVWIIQRVMARILQLFLVYFSRV